MNEHITIDPERAEAKVYYDFINSKSVRVYLVKISFPDAGIHINSITVQPSAKDPSKPWVQSPRFFIKGKWVWPLQLEKAKPVWPLIERLALKAVADFNQSGDGGFEGQDFGTAFMKPKSEFM